MLIIPPEQETASVLHPSPSCPVAVISPPLIFTTPELAALTGLELEPSEIVVIVPPEIFATAVGPYAYAPIALEPVWTFITAVPLILKVPLFQSTTPYALLPHLVVLDSVYSLVASIVPPVALKVPVPPEL